MVGTQVGNYLIEEKLGEGGMGTVYRALEVQLERRVAIKVLNADLAHNANIVERFRAEARAQANLMHPNIAVLYAFLVQDGNAMMVMEYIDGQNIQDIVRRNGPLPVQQAIPWFKQALAGIGAAHHLGIVHRDIKPSNLMLTRAGVVKVLDFGIAKVTGGGRALTSAGTKLGTVFYMSPEQVQAGTVDSRSDIYSLGVTFYEMLTARVPFDSDSDFTVQKDHIQSPPPLPTAFAPGIPRGIEKIVLKALEKNPAERFQTVEEFSAALDNPAAWEAYVPAFARGMQAAAPQGSRPMGSGQQPPPYQRVNVPPPVQPFNLPAAQPVYIPPPGFGTAKSFWADKWKIYALVAVAAIGLGFFLFRGSSAKPEQLAGSWMGPLTCAPEGQQAQPKQVGLVMTAPSFDKVSATDPDGSSPMAGSFSTESSQLTMHLVQNQMVGIQAQVNLSAGTMHGNFTRSNVPVPTCSFSFTRQR